MSTRTIDLTRRLRQWEAGQTVYALSHDPTILPNWERIADLMEELARAVLAGLEAGARNNGQDPVIVSAKVTLDSSVQISDRKAKKRRKS